MKEELCEKVVEVRRVCSGVMTVVVVVFKRMCCGWFVGMLHKEDDL